jgi:hypothetical protein
LGAAHAIRRTLGRTYARNGSVQDLTIDAGTVTARVQGSRARPYRVQLQVPVFDDTAWEAIATALASRLTIPARSCDGSVPRQVWRQPATISMQPSAMRWPSPGSCSTSRSRRSARSYDASAGRVSSGSPDGERPRVTGR